MNESTLVPREELSDWCNTPEKRPADLSEQAVTARLKEATDNVLAAVPELMTDKYKFTPFTSSEDTPEKDVKQDNGWFERGELPPVGEVCEWLECHQTGWQKVTLAGHYENAAWIVPEGKEPITVFNPTGFRPIRTERDVLIEIIKKTDDTDDRIADAILAAGFSLGAK